MSTNKTGYIEALEAQMASAERLADDAEREVNLLKKQLHAAEQKKSLAYMKVLTTKNMMISALKDKS